MATRNQTTRTKPGLEPKWLRLYMYIYVYIYMYIYTVYMHECIYIYMYIYISLEYHGMSMLTIHARQSDAAKIMHGLEGDAAQIAEPMLHRCSTHFLFVCIHRVHICCHMLHGCGLTATPL